MRRCYICVFWCFLCLCFILEVTSQFHWNHQRACGWSGNVISAKKRKLKVEHTSGNVFVDRTTTNRSLETVYYVTDLKQQIDFFWSRESGVRINIGLQDIQLVSTFEDVEHESDNKFIQGSPTFNRRRDQYSRIWRNYCRNPIPPGYSLTMELYLDRTTKAEEKECTFDQWSRGSCPKGVKPGGTFVRRALNEPCVHMGSYPEPLNGASNSLVCLEENSILAHVFNVTLSSERKISMISKRCQRASESCDQCLTSAGCALNNSEQKCCKGDCLSERSCRESFGCRGEPTTCSMGDAYRLTLVPLAPQNPLDFRCHLRRIRPNHLYRYWFYVSVPELNFETSKVSEVFFDPRNREKGSEASHFFRVEHDSGLDVYDGDVILTYKETNKSKTFSIHSFHQKQEDTKMRFATHSMSKNIKVVQVQFGHPFAYSTSTWNGSCAKNLTLFQPFTPGKQSHLQGTKVDLKVERSQGARPAFRYQMKSLAHRPHVKISIPGNQSVFKWWFSRNNVSFPANLISATFSAEDKTWHLNLSGKLLTCPNYLEVSCVDLENEEKLFAIDALVLCPPLLSISLSIPVSPVKPRSGRILKLTAEGATGRDRFVAYLTLLPFSNGARAVSTSHQKAMDAADEDDAEFDDDDDDDDDGGDDDDDDDQEEEKDKKVKEGEEEEEKIFRISLKLLMIFSIAAAFLLISIFISMTITGGKTTLFRIASADGLQLLAQTIEEEEASKMKRHLSLVIFLLQLLHGMIFTFSGIILIILCRVPSSSTKLHKTFQVYACSSHHHLHRHHHECFHRFDRYAITFDEEISNLNASLFACERYIEELHLTFEEEQKFFSSIEKNKTILSEPLKNVLKNISHVTWDFFPEISVEGIDWFDVNYFPGIRWSDVLNIGNESSSGDVEEPPRSFANVPRHKHPPSEIKTCFHRRISDFLLLLKAPDKKQNIFDTFCVRSLDAQHDVHSCVRRYFPVLDVSKEKNSFSVGNELSSGDFEEGTSTSGIDGFINFDFIFWHRIFTFFDFLLLVKRVSATYLVYKRFSARERHSHAILKLTTDEGKDIRVNLPPGDSTTITAARCTPRGPGLSASAKIRMVRQSILGESEGYPVKTLLAAATLVYLAGIWGAIRNGNVLLMTILESRLDLPSKEAPSDVLSERDLIPSYRRLTVFDLDQVAASFVFLKEMIDHRPISANDRWMKLDDNRVNSTPECLLNSCGRHHRSSNSTPEMAPAVEVLKSSFIDVLSSVTMTTALFVAAEMISGNVMLAFMAFCCRSKVLLYSSAPAVSMHSDATRQHLEEGTTCEQPQRDLSLLETHV